MRTVLKFLVGSLVLVMTLSGCSKKADTVEGTITPTVESISAAPATAQRPVPPVTAPVSVEPTSDLDTLTQAVRRFGMERKRVPQSLSEVATAGYIKVMPVAPAGKKFEINTKRLEVILVNQ